MPFKETAALREGDRMRGDAFDLFQSRSGQGDQIMPDAEEQFMLDGYVFVEQEIIVLGDWPGERVFYRNDGRISRSLGKGPEDISGERAGNHGCGSAGWLEIEHHAQRSFMAERT